jgi:hypothetical protein
VNESGDFGVRYQATGQRPEPSTKNLSRSGSLLVAAIEGHRIQIHECVWK